MEATKRYRSALSGSPAEEYLENRGFDLEKLKPYGLGFVEDPLPGHSMFRGWLSIPYLRNSPGGQGWSVISMRFRCIHDHNHKQAHGGGKYMPHPGSKTHLFNTAAVTRSEREIILTEGEFDALAAETNIMPAVGIPGAENWNKKFARMFRGYSKVYVLEDGDPAGSNMGQAIADTLPNVRRIPMPQGMDVNEVILDPDLGVGEILERMGKKNVQQG